MSGGGGGRMKARPSGAQYRHCPTTGKRTYLNKSDAKRTLRWQQTRRGRDSDRPLNVYRCAACGLFHIGHRPTGGPSCG